MSPSKIFVLLFLAICTTQAGLLCSALCQPNDCSGALQTECNSCPPSWTFGSSTCTLDASSGYELVAKSSDMVGGSASITILPSASTGNCGGSYQYYGPHACNTNLSISLASGVTVPHYEIQVIFWIFLYDDSTWLSSNNIYITHASNEVSRVMSDFNSQEAACGGVTQTYYRATASFTHINATGTTLSIDISNDVSDSSCRWGFKQAIVLAKSCHSSCTQCSSSANTACYSCINSMFLSGNTCSNSCLTGYGSVTGSNVCVLCDLRCIDCSENSTYCSSCTLSGANIGYLYNSACAASCPTGTFSSTNPNVCTDCDPKCIQCSINSTFCTSCTLTGSDIGYLLGSACVSNCPTGTYSSTNPNICTNCDPKCIDCSINSTYCASCTLTGANIGYLLGSDCLGSCPTGTFASINPNTCTSCDLKCIECSVNSTFCTSCTLTGADIGFLYGSTCLGSCPTGTYSSTNPNICTDCDPKCSDCSTNSTFCTSCTLTGANIGYLLGSTCVSNCPTGTYSSTNPNTCTSCDPKCIQCSVNSTFCTSCTLNGSNIAYLYNSVCQVNCPTGTYSSANPNVCVDCDLKCIECSINSTYCTSCTLTGTNIGFLYESACLSSCPTGTYSSTNPNLCTKCDPKCTQCSVNSTFCTICTLAGADIGYLYMSTCAASCPTGTYSSTNPNTCTSCDLKCIDCSVNSTYCTSCTLTGTDIGFLYDYTCLSSCPTGTFSSTNPNTCTSCDPKCIQCSVNSTFCTSCTLNGSNIAYLFNNLCYASCPSGTFSSSNPNLCTSCDSKCTSCFQIADNCTSCTTSGSNEAFLDYTVSTYTVCVSSCSSGFANAANHQCDPCTANCLTCQTTSSFCFSCISGFFWLNSSCYSSCPSGYFDDVANCTLCDSKCSVCNASSTNCTVCSSTAYLLNLTCYAACPDPYYEDSTGPNLCLPCNPACSSCTGPSNAVCSACSTNYTLSGTTCDTFCQAGYGISSNPNVCIACMAYCQSCFLVGTNCTLCVSTPTQYYLLTIGTNISCETSCPVGYFINTTALSCIVCPTGCYDCSSKTVCYTCKPTYLYYNQLCHKPCPIGSFQSNSTNCSPCDNECRTCVNSSSNCLSCKTSGTYKSYLLDNVCFLICPVTYYGNNQTNQTCKKCDSACLFCYGGLSSNCTECIYPSVLSGTTCSSSCLAGYGITNDIVLCVKCNDTCKACAYINTNCSSCQTNGTYTAYLYYNSSVGYTQCLMTCPNKTTNISSTQQCLPCSQNCTSCENSTSLCLSCISGFALLNKTCYSACPDGYYLNGLICSTCSKNCSICNISSTNCSVCTLNGTYQSYLLNSSCMSKCPIGYYPTSAPNLCNLCNIVTCISCVGNPDNCSSCQSGYFLYNNSCMLTCPSGFAAFNDTRTCNQTSVFLTLSMKFADSFKESIIIGLNFTYDLDQATFPKQTFQTITLNQSSLNLSRFNIVYSWTSTHSYQILLTPNSQIFIDNATISVETMPLPQYVHNSTGGIPFSTTVYSQSKSLTWFLIKGRQWNTLETSAITSLQAVSNSIKSFTTLSGVQQFNKAGFFSWILPGAQLTSASLLIKSTPPRNGYEGARFWGNFVFFEVPDYQSEREKSKNVVGSSADTLTTNSRLLQQKRNILQTQDIYWRFNRTGFTTFFLYDCYMQMLLITISWVVMLIARKLEERKAKMSVISKFYSIFHSLHQICIFYLTLGLVLEVFYFDVKSGVRMASFFICLIFNVYYLAYQLYIYYDVLKYPLLQLGSLEYREIAKKYGYFLKNIRYDEYDDIEKWSPAHFFRPYNYHITSFYKKYLMILAVAIFYEYPSYAAGALVFIEIFELVRFCISWPFASKKRNIVRLSLEITILVFFLTVFLQTLYVQQISHNNMNTIASATNDFYLVGWISFACIFIINISFFIIFVYDMCCFFGLSNSEEMRLIRRDFYYEKVLKYQNCTDLEANEEMLDSWVVKGDLNENWSEDKEDIIPDIEIMVEKYIINKMGEDGFTVQVEKCVQVQMKYPHSVVSKQKIKVKEQIQGTVALTKTISLNFFMIIKAIFEEYDPEFEADYLTIKTVAKIQPAKYNADEMINLSEEPHSQILTLQYPFDKKKSFKLAVPLRGFPINPELFNPLIYSKTLNRKYLY